MASQESSAEQPSTHRTGKGLIRGATFGVKEVTYAIVDGKAIFEGDIVLGDVDELRRVGTNAADDVATSGVVVPDTTRRWPGGVVPYTIDPLLPSPERITGAIQHWELHTPFRFVTRTNQRDYVTFRDGAGCSSPVGRQGGQQFVTLSPLCTQGSTIHEIGHSIGLWHEQSREDRDSFVTIRFQNIEVGREHNFNQHITDGDDIGPYDYGSIMHYPKNAFAKQPDLITIESPQPIGQRTTLSAGDIAAARFIFNSTPSSDAAASSRIESSDDAGGGVLPNQTRVVDFPLSKPQLQRLTARARELTKRDLVTLANLPARLRLSIYDLKTIVDAFGQSDAPSDPEVQGDACCCAPCCCCCAVSTPSSTVVLA